MSNNEPKLNFLMVQDTLRQIVEMSASVSQLVSQINLAQFDSMRQLIKEISSVCSNDYLRSLNDAARLISQISADSVQDLRNSLLPLQDAVLAAIAVARPYMSPNQIQEAEEIVPDIFEPAPPEEPREQSPKLSFSTLLALFSLLVTIIFGIISTLPDKQLEQITEQNAVLIEQNEELYSLEEEKLAVLRQLLETAENVSDVLDALEQDSDNISDDLDDLSLPDDDPAEVGTDLHSEGKPAERSCCRVK